MMELKDLRDLYACPCDETAMYKPFMVPSTGRGHLVWFEGEEEPYLDLVLGFSCLNFGHCEPAITAAVKEAAEQLAHIHSFNTRPKLELSQRLNDIFEDELGTRQNYQIHFEVGGSNAVDASVLLARHATGKSAFIRCAGSFHGCNYGSAWLSDNCFVDHNQYQKLPGNSLTIPYPDQQIPGASEACLESLQTLITSRNDIAAIIIEPVLGAGGIRLPDPDCLRKIREITKENGIFYIDDEIQMGVGRTGFFFATAHYGIIPDIILLGKSLAGGFSPISAVLASKNIFQKMPIQRTGFQGTFANHAFGSAIANRTIEWAVTEKLFCPKKPIGQRLLKLIQELAEIYDFLSMPRGLGMALAIDVSKTQKGSIIKADPHLAAQIVKIGLENKVILYCCGTQGNTLKLFPRINATEEEADLIEARLRTIFKQTMQSLHA